MKKVVCFLVIVVFIMQLCLSGCEKKVAEQKFTDYSFDYFDTVTTIIGYESSESDFNSNCDKIKELLGEYHSLYTIYNRYDNLNNLCTVNQVENSVHKPVNVDERIIRMLQYAKEMYSITNGRLNVAMGSVLSIWHQYREEGLRNPTESRLPPLSELRDASKHTDINNLIINGEDNTVHLSDTQTKLDVGAIAKGYAVEEVAMWMTKQGMKGYILNVGGNIRTVGERPDGEKWKVGIENPDTEDTQKPYIEYLLLGEMSLVTSGSYQRYYVVDGKNYHHIIDPQTLMPAENFKSVSVLCKSSAKADAFSTALFSMTYEEGKSLVESMPDTEAMWVLPNGEQRYSAGFKDYCENK